MDRTSLVRRIRVLAVLVPIVCGWGWFISAAPIIRWNNQSLSSNKRVVFGDYLFDLSTKTATPFVDDLTAKSFPPNANGFSYRSAAKKDLSLGKQKAPSPEVTFRNTVYNHSQGRMVHDFEVTIGRNTWPRFVTERFLVVEAAEELRGLDLSRSKEDWQVLSIAGSGKRIVWSHSEQPVFRRTYKNPTATTQGTTELFRFTEGGEIQLLTSWTHLANATLWFSDTKFSGNRIFSIDVTGANLESRSTLDGKLVESIPLETPVTSFAFWNATDCLCDIGVKGIFYSLNGKRLTNPVDQTAWQGSLRDLSPDARNCLWTDGKRAFITDAESGRLVCEIKEHGLRFVFLDSQTLISTDSGWGLTLRQHDLVTGETLLRWRPFWWMLPCLAALSSSTLVWIWLWIRMPKPDTNWGWSDFYILLSLIMAGLISRVTFVGDPNDTSRSSFLYAQAVCSSGIFLAWTMLFFGSQRWILRLIHLLAVYGIVLISLAVVLPDRPLEACQGLIMVSLPSVFALPIWIAVAIYSRLRQRARSERSDDSLKQQSIQLRELFWLMGIVALCAIGLKPLLPGMGAWFQLPWGLLQLAWVTVSACTGIVTALSRNRRWERVGFILCTISLCLLTVDVSMISIHGEFWQFRYSNWLGTHASLLIACVGTLVTSFVFARCLKQQV
ncbi:MAG: hypothetical protein NTY15_10850 [Planctomycetota bacterium]|nr:hypothetical protein [Planctomycetota bacterium]